MSNFDSRVPQDVDMPIQALKLAHDDDVPARRLLAHDLEPLVWDDDGESPLPPPD